MSATGLYTYGHVYTLKISENHKRISQISHFMHAILRPTNGLLNA